MRSTAILVGAGHNTRLLLVAEAFCVMVLRAVAAKTERSVIAIRLI